MPETVEIRRTGEEGHPAGPVYHIDPTSEKGQAIARRATWESASYVETRRLLASLLDQSPRTASELGEHFGIRGVVAARYLDTDNCVLVYDKHRKVYTAKAELDPKAERFRWVDPPAHAQSPDLPGHPGDQLNLAPCIEVATTADASSELGAAGIDHRALPNGLWLAASVLSDSCRAYDEAQRAYDEAMAIAETARATLRSALAAVKAKHQAVVEQAPGGEA